LSVLVFTVVVGVSSNVATCAIVVSSSSVSKGLPESTIPVSIVSEGFTCRVLLPPPGMRMSPPVVIRKESAFVWVCLVAISSVVPSIVPLVIVSCLLAWAYPVVRALSGPGVVVLGSSSYPTFSGPWFASFPNAIMSLSSCILVLSVLFFRIVIPGSTTRFRLDPVAGVVGRSAVVLIRRGLVGCWFLRVVAAVDLVMSPAFCLLLANALTGRRPSLPTVLFNFFVVSCVIVVSY